MLEFLGMLIVIIGALICLAGGIMFLIAGFQEHVAWGLGIFFFQIAGLVFLILHWDRAKEPFKISVVGSVVVFFGLIVGAVGR